MAPLLDQGEEMNIEQFGTETIPFSISLPQITTAEPVAVEPPKKPRRKKSGWTAEKKAEHSARLKAAWGRKRLEHVVNKDRLQAHVLVAKDGSKFVTMSASPGLLEFLQTQGFQVIVLTEN